jgi:hypothetical protein
MKGLTRRQFLAGSVAAGAAVLLGPHARVLGANEDVRMAVVGFNGQGRSHIEGFRVMPGVRITALCDCDKKVLDAEVKRFEDRNEKVAAYQDVRRVLDDKNVDAVVTATPNHWHALLTVWACQAGKDVYVEKPVSHEIWEGRKAVEAARKYSRVVQAGTQNRSDPGLQEALEWLKAGNLGKIVLARGFCYKERKSIGKCTEPLKIPDHIDYDLWCGPAPKKPLMRKKFHYDWHWLWDTGNADIGNQGIHEVDQCRWALGQGGIAPRAMSIGGRFGYEDDAETPNTQIAFLDYKPAPMIFEVRGLPRKTGDNAMDVYRGLARVGIVIDCEGGYFSGGWAFDKDGKKVKQFKRDGGGSHRANFVKALRSRKPADNPADILEGHLSACLFHMANISYRLGKERPSEEIADLIKADKDHADAFERFKAHLEANGVDLKNSRPILGPWLELDAEKERFTGTLADEANKQVKREYRAPFVLPDVV